MVYSIPNCGFSRSYVISGTDGLMIVDVGSVGAANDIKKFISGHPGMAMEDVRFVTATHYHIDHIGGMGAFLKRCPPSTKILYHPLVREYFRGTRKLSLIRNWFTGFTPALFWCSLYVRALGHLRFENLSGIPLPGLRNRVQRPCPENRIGYFDLNVSSPLDPKDKRKRSLQTCSAGFDSWEVIETPGHTEDSLCLYNPATREMICGDLLINMVKNGRGRLNHFCWSLEITYGTYRELVDTLCPLVIYPGHGDAIKHPQNALSAVEVFNLS
jgi:glyoxylase-like metal-dependent hydrolase (beta-lactamase superfamily II)